MKQLLLSIAIIIAVSCGIVHNNTPQPQPTPLPTSTDTAKINSYVYMGGISFYATADEAFANSGHGRNYYCDIPVLAIGKTLFETSNTSAKVNGGGQWVCLIQMPNGTTWVSVQVGTNGEIISTKSY